jgi:hypothetical protein
VKRLFFAARLLIKHLLIALGLGDRLVEFCHDCGRKQPVPWHAPDNLWLTLNHNLVGGTACPECFNRRAEVKGFMLTWEPKVMATYERQFQALLR